MRTIVLSIASVLALSGLFAVTADAADVSVLTAWYGQSCGTAHGNVTSIVKASCDGKPTCQYSVEAKTLGDSAPGCRKNFIVLYACTGQPTVRLGQLPGEASGQSLTLSCVEAPK